MRSFGNVTENSFECFSKMQICSKIQHQSFYDFRIKPSADSKPTFIRDQCYHCARTTPTKKVCHAWIL